MENLKAVLLIFLICILVSCNSIKRQSSFNDVRFEIEQVKIDKINENNNFDLVEIEKNQKEPSIKTLAKTNEKEDFKMRKLKQKQLQKVKKYYVNLEKLPIPIVNIASIKSYNFPIADNILDLGTMFFLFAIFLLSIILLISAFIFLIFGNFNLALKFSIFGIILLLTFIILNRIY